MRTKNNIPPALLSTGIDTAKVWTINIDIGTSKVLMQFTEKALAQAEFNQMRIKGVYGGKWIKEITLNEQARD